MAKGRLAITGRSSGDGGQGIFTGGTPTPLLLVEVRSTVVVIVVGGGGEARGPWKEGLDGHDHVVFK